MSTISLSLKDVESVPTILGEKDILKAIQLLPGVKSGVEGTSGIYVRGGGPDQNLILMDGVPIYNVAHFFGFFSVFNPDAINNVDVIKGGFPAKYGGRLSSVIDISMKEGNSKKLTGKGTIGLISSKFTIEGPIKNDKTSFIASVRRTYFDLFTKPFQKEDKVGYHFIDFNAKVNHRVSPKDRLFLSFYGGQDKFSTHYKNNGNSVGQNTSNEFKGGLEWGNILSVFRWNRIITPKLFGNLSASLSQYQFNLLAKTEYNEPNKNEELKYLSGIHDLTLKLDLDYLAHPNHNITIGAAAINHEFNTGTLVFVNPSQLSTPSVNEELRAHELSFYFNESMKVRALVFNLGLHSSIFNVKNKTYFYLQPRLSSSVELSKSFTVTTSYSEMA